MESQLSSHGSLGQAVIGSPLSSHGSMGQAVMELQPSAHGNFSKNITGSPTSVNEVLVKPSL
jgi:hypothetical protein